MALWWAVHLFVTTHNFDVLQGGGTAFASQAEWVRSSCKQHNITFLDPTYAFRHETQSWFAATSVGHYTPRGHMLFAEGLYKNLTEAGAFK